MAHFLKPVAVVAAISLGALALVILSGGAGDKHDKPPALANDLSDEVKASPPVRASRRPLDLPLQHAILRDEKRKDESAEAVILETLGKSTTVEFLDLPLEDCLTFLKEFHKLNIWLDRNSLTDEGVALDQPITLKLAGVSLESILHLLLQPVQLEWIVQDEVLKITTVEWARNHPETRTYDVHNLIEAGHTPEELMASITKCIAPGSWTGKDAHAAISHTGGILVVRQSQPVQGEIGRLLEELDTVAEAAEEEDAEKGGKNAVVSVKVYPAGEQSAEQVAECLQEFVASNTWKNRGGDGKVRAVKGALVVEQTAGVHWAIQQFIGQLSSRSPAVSTARGATGAAGGAANGASADPFGVLSPAERGAVEAGKPGTQKQASKSD